MNFSSKEVETILKQELGSSIQLLAYPPTPGGDINQAWQLKTNQGNFFLKTNKPQLEIIFQQEQLALDIIKASNTLLCPKPINFGKTDNFSWLLMEFIELTSQGDDYLRGQQLAQMHQVTSDKFGWQADNFIGRTPQYNSYSDNWLDFYANQRLKPQLNFAQQNAASTLLLDSGYQLIEELDKFFINYTPLPSLLHGDLWGGNSAFTTSGHPIIYDPASYYGDRETDLAMTEMFGGFSSNFYQGYNSVYPLDQGYKTRKDLYNLYHLLNHFNLFGGHYEQSSIRVIQQLLN